MGAGSAGCVLANRLSESGKHHISILEAGGADRGIWLRIPIGYGKTYYDERVNWMYNTEPEPNLNGRSSYWPRGKVLGGSSSINAMVYVRGQRRDFDDWEARGNPGWSADDLLPVFDRFEDRDGRKPLGRGDLHVTDTRSQIHPLCQQWLEAGQQAGFTLTDDFNGDNFEGFGRYSISTKNGFRHSTARAFLHPVLKRENLRMYLRAHATRVLFDGNRAVGVEYRQHGKTHRLNARKEVLLCGGTVNSPQLLQLSGIGNAALLSSLDIPVVYDNAAVGQNLQDHVGINYYYKSTVPTINDQLGPLIGKIKVGLQYMLQRKGLLSLSVNQAGGFVKTDPSLKHPNMQLYFNPISYTKAPEGTRPLMHPDRYSAFLLSFQPCRPTSRGHLQIHSPDPFEPPEIHPNYLSTNEDIAEVLAGCRLMRTLSETEALSRIIDHEFIPGSHVQSDEALLDDFRNRGDTVFHPVSTCIMGPDARDSVVDPTLKVHGVENLRVIDASVFPNLTSGNTNAPTIMVAEKGAELVIAEQ